MAVAESNAQFQRPEIKVRACGLSLVGSTDSLLVGSTDSLSMESEFLELTLLLEALASPCLFCASLWE